jgi:putative ABC transport system permease protein
MASGEVGFSTLQPHEIVKGFKEDIPGVTFSTAFRKTPVWIGYGEKKLREMVGFADLDFFEIFSHKFIAGNKESALKNLYGVVLTRTAADKFFSDTIPEYSDMIGEVLEFPQRMPNLFKVTAIIEDVPENASLQFDVVLNILNCVHYPRSNNAFGANSVYVKLSEESDPEESVKTANALIDKYRGQLIQDMIHFGSLKDSDDNFRFIFQPLNRVYLHSTDMWSGYEMKGNAQNTYILSIIALIILAVACINYVMLSIGQSMDRVREMGIKKIMGAHRKQIIRQFILESLILVFFALIIGIAMAEQLLPVFNTLASKDLAFAFYKEPGSYFYLLVILLLIVISTGGYISFFLLRHSNPLSILRKEITMGRRYRFAGSFVILQYFITVALMIITATIVRQLDYMIKKPVGYETDDIVVLSVDFPVAKTLLLKEKLEAFPAIRSVTTSDRNFISGRSSGPLRSATGELVETRILRIDPDYTETLGIELVTGRNFSPGHVDDSIFAVLVNETFADAFELSDPVGHKMLFEGEGVTIEIIGVVKDFHYDSMKDPIMPLLMHVAPRNSIWYVFVKVDPGNIPKALEDIHLAWDEVVPEYQIEYTFLDESLEEQYMEQERWGRITGYSALMAIFLSCLGLLGLTGLLVSKRVKEIGIRRVNGARITDIILLINRKFQTWVVVAVILACIPAYFTMRKWLENFTYKLPLAWWIFVLAGMVAILIALLTVTWGSWKYARKNPTQTLRYE